MMASAAQYERLAQGVNPPVWLRLDGMLLHGRRAPPDPCRAPQSFE